MKRIDLCGHWEAVRTGGGELFSGTVPGCVHNDLFDAGLIDDPLSPDTGKLQLRIDESGWSYSRPFDVDADFLAEERIALRCEGLSAPAEIRINDIAIARTDGLFTIREVDVKKQLREGANEIRIDFTPPPPVVRRPGAACGADGNPMPVRPGIRGPIGLIGWSAARIGEVRIRQEHGKRNGVRLSVQISAERAAKQESPPLRAEVTVALDGERIARETVDLERGRGETDVPIRRPRLWWPNGMGEQPLYDVRIALSGPGGEELDLWERRIGLRIIRLERRADGGPRFTANGRPFFVKGADWMPSSLYGARMSPEQYDYLIGSARDANMNMLRVKGDGAYEDEPFYDLCDRYGICIRQDFMLDGTPGQAVDATFAADLKREAAEAVRRLRHHPCLALWCGHGGDGAGDGKPEGAGSRKIFERLLPSVVEQCDPERDYLPADRLFSGGFGFPSFPEPDVVLRRTLPGDRNLGSPALELQSRNIGGIGVVAARLLDDFLLPESFEMQLRLSQILQGLIMKEEVEKRRRARCPGIFFRQLNELRPEPGEASIDHRGNWKALHYMARDFYAPLLVSGAADPVAGTVDVHVSSDLAGRTAAALRWRLIGTDGSPVDRNELDVGIAAGASRRVTVLKLGEHLRDRGARNLLLLLELSAEGHGTARNLVLFARPKSLSLRNPEILASIAEGPGGSFAVALKAARPALWVWPEIEGVPAAFSDRFFHLEPESVREVTVLPGIDMSADQMRERLRITSLYDSCPEYASAYPDSFPPDAAGASAAIAADAPRD